MDIKFKVKAFKLEIITEKPLIGSFINSYFIWDDDFERVKDKLLSFLERTDYKNLQKIRFGTYDDLFIHLIEENNIRKIRLYVGMDPAYESITEIKIDLKEFKKILDMYIREKAEFEKNPQKYAEKLKSKS